MAIVSGGPADEEGCIDLTIMKSARRNFIMEINKKGKESKTDYIVQERFNNYSLVLLKPQSGRTHQIRVHLKAIGCPLAVDPLYGTRSQIDLSMIKKKYRYKEEEKPRPLSDRLTLHAHRLSFINPQSGQEMNFEAPVPKDFKAVLTALRKWDRQESILSSQIVHEQYAI